MSRLDTRIWLDGHLRQLAARGEFYTIMHKGDAERGSVILKLNMGESTGCRILTQAYNADGELGWLAALEGRTVPEGEADAYLNRMAERDSDVWIVEIESRDGTHPFPGKLLG